MESFLGNLISQPILLKKGYIFQIKLKVNMLSLFLKFEKLILRKSSENFSRLIPEKFP